MSMRLILAGGLALSLAGCDGYWARVQENIRAEQERQQAQQAAINSLPYSDRLECEMHGQLASASASNPRALIDINAAVTGASVTNTCLQMKLSLMYERHQQREASVRRVQSVHVQSGQQAKSADDIEMERYLGKPRPSHCADPTVTNPYLLAECR